MFEIKTFIAENLLIRLKRKNKNVLVTTRLSNYLYNLNIKNLQDELIKKYVEITSSKNGSYQTPLSQISFLQLLIKSMNAKSILEIGTFKGFTTLFLAESSKDCKVTTCENNENNLKDAIKLWEQRGANHKIKTLVGLATDSLEQLIKNAAKFDFIYIDANKNDYKNYYHLALNLVHEGSVIAIDNSLWAGLVAYPNTKYSHANLIAELNEELFGNKQIHATLIPAWDGLTLIYIENL